MTNAEKQRANTEFEMGVDAAMKRAGERAKETAKMYGQKLIVVKDGKVLEVDPDFVTQSE